MLKKDKLEESQIEATVRSLRSLATFHTNCRQEIRIETSYFENNKDHMRHAKFRKQVVFVGSGVIESDCKTVLGTG